jgi:hypothetical protein
MHSREHCPNLREATPTDGDAIGVRNQPHLVLVAEGYLEGGGWDPSIHMKDHGMRRQSGNESGYELRLHMSEHDEPHS